MATHDASAMPSDLIALMADGGLVVAVTDDGTDPRYAADRDASARIAGAAGGKVLLYCLSTDHAGGASGRPRFFFPAVEGAPGVAARPHTGSRHRDLLSAEAAAIRAHGIDVAAWLPGRSGSAGMAEAVAVTNAALLLLPAEAEREGVRRRTLDYHAAKIPAPVVAVDPAGRLSLVQPLGGHRPEAAGSDIARSTVRRRLPSLATGWTR